MKPEFGVHLKTRLLAIHLFGILSLCVCLALSNWQWQRAHVWSEKSPDSLGTVQAFEDLSPLREFLPATSIGARTEVTGQWITDSVRTYCNRPQDGSIIRTGIEIGFTPGCWVTGVLSLSDQTVLTVVIGWSPDNSGTTGLSTSLPTGEVTVQGILQPSEDSLRTFLPSNTRKITTEETVKQVRRSAHDGYLLQTESPTGLSVIAPVFEVAPSQSVHWRNVVYTFNWLFFGLFAVFMWWRAVRDEMTEQALRTQH